MANKNCKKCGGSGSHRSCLWYGRDGNGYKGWWDCQRSKSTDGYCRHSSVECSSCNGCYITTATLNALGKVDNCEELNTFRHFRDTYLNDNFPEKISEYYHFAPLIVSSIEKQENPLDIYSELWVNTLEPGLKLLNANKNEEAFYLYKEMVEELLKEYL